MKTLLDSLYDCNEQQEKLRSNIQTVTWDNLDDKRNVGFLKLLLACALASKENFEEDPSRNFVSEVEDENAKRLRCVEVDVKDIAIATMLVSFEIFYSQYAILIPNY
jgi:hypothetical protein